MKNQGGLSTLVCMVLDFKSHFYDSGKSYFSKGKAKQSFVVLNINQSGCSGGAQCVRLQASFAWGSGVQPPEGIWQSDTLF